MRRIFSFLKPYKKQLVVGPSFKLLEAILELLIPTLMVSIVDIGVQNKDTSYILKMGGLMLGIAAVGLLSALICQYSASIAQGFGTDVRNALFKHIMSLSSKELDEIGTTGYTTRLTNDINTLQLAVAMLIRLVIRAPFITRKHCHGIVHKCQTLNHYNSYPAHTCNYCLLHYEKTIPCTKR